MVITQRRNGKMTKQDIEEQIQWYKTRIIEDPGGQNLYEALIETLEREMEKKI